MIGKDYPELQTNNTVVTQLVPSTGWKAAFVDQLEGEDGSSSMVITTDPVVCWGLEMNYDSRLSMTPVDSNVVGYIATPRLEIAENQSNFLGYVPEGEDTSIFHHLAMHVLEHLGEEDDEGNTESAV